MHMNQHQGEFITQITDLSCSLRWRIDKK